ncbi:MAG: translocation/assembly module TamB domain-containing protein [Algibacter sp.]|uniref:translocation/assembly module TamB domain-containing protein n=1 Tax=Algibacter sp. TaxID=1872428 RepID=UPI0026398F76|nr:translocation/assembly module TamB [Algibacter sp.]MDG1730067.1 translocation/assembly module TamB domain-containing protein [Algibacter sp.]MDG2179809.1 translocation/assembly module TamB domain-containing protein [Algibacter sp.]
MLVFSIPFVQTTVGKRVTKMLNDDFKTNINIDRVSLQFNGDVEIKNIYIEDYKKDTLISIAELNTSILNFGNLFQGKLVFGDIDIENLLFHIKTYEGATDTNLDIFVDRFEDDNPRTGKSSFLMSSSDVSIYKSVFMLSNENKETTKVLHFENLNINATNFLIHGSDVSMRINTLSFKDSRGVVVKNLMTDFAYTLTDMTFANMQIKTPGSILKGDLKFSYLREDLKYFTDKVQVHASFKDSNVLLDELNTFYNEFGVNQSAKFSADLSGTLNDLQTSNLKLNTNANTRVYGHINFKNLFNKESDNFYMNGNFSNLSSTYNDLKGLLPNVLGDAIPSSFDRLGYFTIIGNSQVTSSKVIADIEIDTELGFVDSNLEITKINDIDNADYKGNIIFEQFDFGIFLNDPKVGRASLDVNVDGKGFTTETVDTKVKGEIFELVYNNYNYNRIKVAGNIQNRIFDGNLNVNDKNLQLNFSGLVDFSETIRKYDFEAIVDYADLKALNFIKRDSISIFKSKVNMNMNSSSIDDAFGKIAFSNSMYKNENDSYYFNTFDVSSRFEKNIRFVEFNSPDIIEGELKGRFFLKDLKKLFENSIGHIYTNYIPHDVDINQSIDFNFKIYNKIVEVIYPEIELAKNTFIRGRVESAEENFKLTFKSPKIKYLENFANNIELQVDNSNPLFNTFVEIDSLNTKFYDVSKFSLINVTVNDTLFMRSEFSGGKRNNDAYNLSFYHTINSDNESVIGFKQSDITIKKNTWMINENQDRFHKISFDKKLTKFNIDKFKINHNNEEIKLSGFLRDSTQKDLKLNFTNVDLAKITPDIDSLSLAGNVNGKLDILQKNGSYLPNSSIIIDDFRVNDFLLGSFDATISGNEFLTEYEVDATIKNDITTAFGAKGNIFVSGRKSTIDVTLDFNAFNLSPLNPLLDGVLSNIRGEANGDVKVIGDLRKPDINGDLIIKNGGLGIPYLNVDYDFNTNASVTLKNQSFIFNKIRLTDTKYNSIGLLDGSLSHVNFAKWSLGLNITTPRLLILDTEEAEESLYYGTGFIGGRASIFGPTEQLVISVVGETKRGTVFKIPLSDAESFGDNSYIHFITKQEKEARKQGVEVVFEEIKGLELDFDLDVTEEAEVELIIDKNTGHSLKGRGRGGLLVEINTNGKFDMWGDFAVFEGVYNFAYGGLVQKQFLVQPGGTIAWEGEPAKPIIDMLATYKTQTNPSPLLDNPINRSIPVEVNISLSGDLEQLNPIFSFEFPNVNSTIKSELQYRLESQEYKQDQALYLISTGSFSRGINEVNFSGTIAERLNGIINGIFTSEDSKLNVGLNYEAGQNRPDYQTDDRFGVTLQTQISDRVLINGKVGVPVGGATETVIAGDVEIDFLLNEEGTLTAKVFNRENSIRNFGEAIGYTQGIGLSYNVDFDTFKELIQKLFKNSKEQQASAAESSEKNKEKSIPKYISFKKSSKK